MNAHSRITAPSRDIASFYAVECQYGADPVFKQTTRFFNEAECVREIIEGQFRDIIRVLAITPDEGTCRDSSEDIARLIARLNPEIISPEAIAFCARHKCLTWELGEQV